MKTLWFILLLLLAAPVTAQQLGQPQIITVIDSGTACVTAPKACATFPTNIAGSIAIDVSGTWTGTLTFEATANGDSWRSVQFTNPATGAVGTTTTAGGTFAITNAGYVGVRARATAAVTGAATVTATQGYLAAKRFVPVFPLTFTAGDLLYASAASTVSGISDVAVGQVLVSGGVGVVPAYTANPAASTFTANQPNITTVSTDGLIAANATAATAGVPVQQSPRIRLRSNVWNTTATAANNTNDWWIESVPVSGTTPSGFFKISSSLNGGASSPIFSVATVGPRIVLGTNDATTNGAAWNMNAGALEAKTGDGTAFAALKSLSFSTTTGSIIAGNSIQSGSGAFVASATGAVSKINSISTVGLGVPAIYAAANITAQSSNATITSYANTGADADFEVSGQMSVTASTALTTTITCTYTDVANVARTMILPVQTVTGTFVAAGAITGAGASIWVTPVMHLRAKASTTITLLTSAGTFTGVTYSASGVIKQLQ